jgi:hypothetical protein
MQRIKGELLRKNLLKKRKATGNLYLIKSTMATMKDPNAMDPRL